MILNVPRSTLSLIITSLLLPISLAQSSHNEFERAEGLFREHRFAEAEPLYSHLKPEDPNYLPALLRLGTIYEATGRAALAEEQVREYLRYRQSAEAYCLLADAQIDQHKLGQARQSANAAIRLNGKYAKAYNILGLIYAFSSDWSRSDASFQQALQQDDKDWSTWFLLGRSYYLRNELDKAKEALETALKLSPQSVESCENLAMTLDRMGEQAEAEKLFKKGLDLNNLRTPPDAQIHIAYGIFLFRLNRLEESFRQLSEAVKAAPQNSEAHFELAKVLFRMGRLPEAAQEGETALSTGGPDYRVHYLLARIYTATGKMDKASAHAHEASRLAETSR